MLLRRMSAARTETDKLFQLVKPEALYDRPIPERHRFIFYMGHLEAFDWNLLQSRLPGLKTFDPSLDQLFAFGIDPVGAGLPTDTTAAWPAENRVTDYRDRIRSDMDAALIRSPAGWAGGESPATLLNAAIEHRLMHAETLAYMLHQLPYDRKRRESQVSVAEGRRDDAGGIQIPSGPAELGLARQDQKEFGWDNEFAPHSVHVPSFLIDRYKATNAQFLEFLEAGGYQEQSLWTPEGWDWKQRREILHPAFWKRVDGVWWYLAMFDEIPLPLEWPVYVSHAEASAYARWAGKRLPSEAEWQRAAYGTPDGTSRPYPWGSEAPRAQHGFFDFARWDPFPVHAYPETRSAFGVEGLAGSGWEWTSSAFEPFPGFLPFPFYESYSANFFDGMHPVMKGGSMRTDRSMLRPSFRNWFQPHYQYVYAGFRCAAC
ncbi:MAG: SUMF1/EgtB/PvdO family nonheme iron enzyme [Acidobacteriia bacterium]|nr:SUMF1/EgtB/PvdO family nonheme iron enzyme [Terriglobia bacterium]